MTTNNEIFTHTVKVFCTSGKIERINCISLQDAQATRRERIAQGGATCALVGTCEEIMKIDSMFNEVESQGWKTVEI